MPNPNQLNHNANPHPLESIEQSIVDIIAVQFSGKGKARTFVRAVIVSQYSVLRRAHLVGSAFLRSCRSAELKPGLLYFH